MHTTLVAEVASASNQQSEGLAQINTAISLMDKVTDSSAASAEETAAAAEQLNAKAEELRNSSAQLADLVGVKVDANAALRTHAKVVKPIKTLSS